MVSNKHFIKLKFVDIVVADGDNSIDSVAFAECELTVNHFTHLKFVDMEFKKWLFSKILCILYI